MQSAVAGRIKTKKSKSVHEKSTDEWQQAYAQSSLCE